jgi:hypothetical protein
VIMAEPLHCWAYGFCLLDDLPGRCGNDIAISFALAATQFRELDPLRVMPDHDHASTV